ncbi:MAG TPA: arginine N-succinyltransferase [Dongiaceae bacterium]|nr:arginine N-succinyltransferase [Dongiaceae bacterium]
MLLVRMATPNDLPGLVKLAHTSGGGLTTLPLDEDVLARKLERADQTRQQLQHNGDGLFLFVLEDTDTGTIVGTSGVETSVGLTQPWYTYRVGTIVHASTELNIYHQFPLLFLTNDHTGCSELCSLYLHPDYRRHQAGGLLSKCRFLFIASQRHLFAAKTIAELRGFIGTDGTSPFWEGLGRHFFDMDFSDADYLSAVSNKQFIAELMPRYPFYTRFLPQSARDVIGREHNEAKPARVMLEQEGFRYEGYVDIFDAGPTLETYTDNIRAVRKSQSIDLQQITALTTRPLLLANASRTDFRCVLLQANPSPWHCHDPSSAWPALQLGNTEHAQTVALYGQGHAP